MPIAENLAVAGKWESFSYARMKLSPWINGAVPGNKCRKYVNAANVLPLVTAWLPAAAFEQPTVSFR